MIGYGPILYLRLVLGLRILFPPGLPRCGPEISWQLGTFRTVELRGAGLGKTGGQIVRTSGATEEVIKVSTISFFPVFGFNRFAPLNSI